MLAIAVDARSIFVPTDKLLERWPLCICEWFDLPFLAALLTLLFVVIGVPGCRTREDSARRTGREAAITAARGCQGDGGATDGCRERLCRELCAPFADSVQLSEACTGKCMGRGICDSDADCGPGFVCVMIAPRVRRCELHVDEGP